jgi:hypothetical protein
MRLLYLFSLLTQKRIDPASAARKKEISSKGKAIFSMSEYNPFISKFNIKFHFATIICFAIAGAN